jgi:hypothetical protein
MVLLFLLRILASFLDDEFSNSNDVEGVDSNFEDNIGEPMYKESNDSENYSDMIPLNTKRYYKPEITVFKHHRHRNFTPHISETGTFMDPNNYKSHGVKQGYDLEHPSGYYMPLKNVKYGNYGKYNYVIKNKNIQNNPYLPNKSPSPQPLN